MGVKEMDQDKKIAAAVSGVMAYLKEEKGKAGVLSTREGAPSTYQGAWGLSGRQTQMQMRTMVTMKAFHRKKLN